MTRPPAATPQDGSREGARAKGPVKLIPHPGGRRRVAILRDANGWFTFEEQAGHDVDIAGIEASERRRWASLPTGGGMHGTAAEAEREARAAIDWLRGETASRCRAAVIVGPGENTGRERG